MTSGADDIPSATPAAAELGYFTLRVGDLPRAKRFFNEVLAWQFEDDDASEESPQSAHAVNLELPGGLQVGGDLPATLYFSVTDIDAAVAKVRELGGQAGEIATSPSGRNSACVDDQGTTFSLWEPAPGY